MDENRAEKLISQVGEAILELSENSKTSNDLEEDDLSYVYNELKYRNILKSYLSVDMDVIPYKNKYVSQEKLEELTALNIEALSPGKSNNIFAYAGAFLFLIEISIGQYFQIDPLTTLVPGTFLLFAVDKFVFGGAISETILRFFNPTYKAKIVRHEAGHFLLAYLLGCPISGCILDPWKVRKYIKGGQGGTIFADPIFSKGLMSGNITKSSVDRFSVVLMGGIAAEAILYEKSEGGASDESYLIELLSSLQPPFSYSMIKIQARWAALQAVLLLKEHMPAYEALVEGLENGESLGSCILSIERAIEKLPQPTPLQMRKDEFYRERVDGEEKLITSQAENLRKSIEESLMKRDFESAVNAKLKEQLEKLGKGKVLDEVGADEGGVWLNGGLRNVIGKSSSMSDELKEEFNEFKRMVVGSEDGAKEKFSNEIGIINERLKAIENDLERILSEQSVRKCEQ